MRTLILDSFVKFGCSLCPDFEPESFHAWDSHFYKSYETCKSTYRESKKAEEQLQSSSASASAVSTVVEGLAANFAEDDLRRLICQLCQVEINQVGFAGMGEHLKASHDVDVLTSKENFEEHVEFACAACPQFKPPTVMLWDSHFADSFKTCQVWQVTFLS